MIHSDNGFAPGANTPCKTTSESDRDSAKHIATLRAKLALAGHAVHMTTDGGFWVSKFNLSYFAKDLDALQAFALKLGVK